MNTALSGSVLQVNNETTAYMANSLKYTRGTPERKLDPQVVGNGAVVNVATEDYSTAKGMVSFDLKTTSENELLVNDWVENFDENAIKIISSDGVARIFQKATIINKPEFDTGSDGIISIEFETEQAVSG